MEATQKTKDKYWGHWQDYAEALGVDPLLSESTTPFHLRVRALAGFAGRVRTGYFGHGREIGAQSVSTALTAVGQEISMVCGVNPVKLDGSDKLLYPLAVTLDGFRKWDKPTKKKAPVEADVVELLCNLGYTGLSDARDAVIGDWCLIAFYFLLRVGEYTTKGKRAETKQTVQFRVKDVTFFYHDKLGRLRQLRKNASDEEILHAAGATLRLSNQKNGWKNVCIYHEANGDEVLCPVRALGRRFVHIRTFLPDDDLCPLSAYFVNGIRSDLKDGDVRAALKVSAERLGYPKRGVPITSIDTHSLRAGGANALSLNGYSRHEIMKMGRWRSDTFLEYIAEGISSFSEGMSKAMKKTFQYVNVQAGASSDVVELTEEVCRLPYEVAVSVAAPAA